MRRASNGKAVRPDGSPGCGVRGIGQVAKLLAARAEVRLTRAFGSGTVWQGRSRRERGVEVTAREQEGWRMGSLFFLRSPDHFVAHP